MSLSILTVLISIAMAAGKSPVQKMCEQMVEGKVFSQAVDRQGQQAYLLLPVNFEQLLTLSNHTSLAGFRLQETKDNANVNHLIPVPKESVGKPLTDHFLLTSLSKTPTVMKLGGEFIPALGLNLYLKDFAYLVVDLKALDQSLWMLVHHLQLKLNDPKAYSGSTDSGDDVTYDSLAEPEQIAEFFNSREENFIVHRERRTPVGIVRPGMIDPLLVQGLILPKQLEMSLSAARLKALKSQFRVFATDSFPEIKAQKGK